VFSWPPEGISASPLPEWRRSSARRTRRVASRSRGSRRRFVELEHEVHFVISDLSHGRFFLCFKRSEPGGGDSCEEAGFTNSNRVGHWYKGGHPAAGTPIGCGRRSFSGYTSLAGGRGAGLAGARWRPSDRRTAGRAARRSSCLRPRGMVRQLGLQSFDQTASTVRLQVRHRALPPRRCSPRAAPPHPIGVPAAGVPLYNVQRVEW